MEGDIFHNAIGESCTLDLPYSEARVNTMRNNVSVARSKEAIAKSSKDAAYNDYRDCKRKIFCRAAPKHDRFRTRENEHRAAQSALKVAETDVVQADKANGGARMGFEKCKKEEAARQKAEAELKKTLQAQELEQMKVSAVNLETGKDYMLYGVVGLGVVSALVVGGILILKK